MDGVFVDSWDSGNEAFLKLKFNGNTMDEVVKNHKVYTSHKPYHAKGEKVTPEKIKMVTDQLEQAFIIMQQSSKHKFFDGFVNEVLKIKDARFALVSANSRSHLNHFTMNTEIKFTHALSFEDDISKESKVEKVISDWNIKNDEAIYVTDTLADIYELQDFMPKTNLIGCAWGYSGYEDLAKELPERQIMKEFKDIHDIIEKILPHGDNRHA